MAKRSASEGSGTPASKRPSLLGVDIGPISSQDELDLKILQVQNKKLCERLKERNYCMEQLRREAAQLKTSHTDGQQKLLLLKQCWTSLEQQVSVGLASLGLPSNGGTDSGGSSDAFARQLVALNSAKLQLVAQTRCDRTSDNIRRLLGSVRDEVERLSTHPGHVSKDSGGSDDVLQALETELNVWKKRNSQKLHPSSSSSGASWGEGLDEDNVVLLEEQVAQLEGSLADTKFDLQKYQTRTERLERQLTDTIRDLQNRPLPPSDEATAQDQGTVLVTSLPSSAATSITTMDVTIASGIVASGETARSELNEGLQLELSEVKEVAENRLKEIDDLHKQLTSARTELERVKLECGNISEADVKASSVFKALQSHFSVVFADNSQLRAHLGEVKRLMVMGKQQYLVQVDELMAEHHKYRAEVRDEVLQLEDNMAAMRQQYDLVRMEFEKSIASSEQAAPINKELRQMIGGLEHTIRQQKMETQHYQQQSQQAEERMSRLQAERSEEREQEAMKVEQESKEVEQLKERINKLGDEKHNMEILLDVYKGVPKEQRDRAQVVASERRYREEIELLKAKVVQQKKEFDRKREHLKEDMLRRQKQILEDNKQLQNSLAGKKQEAEALMSEVEVTGQAYDDVQEQNMRLLEQLKEKEDSNIKFMSERIKHNNVQRLMTEEKDMITGQLSAVQQECDALRDVIRKMEERDQSLEATIAGAERELSLAQQTMELHKKKAFDSAQSAHELTLRISELESQLKQHQGVIGGKVEQLEGLEGRLQRSQEDTSILRRRVDKYKNRESASIADEVLLEEIKTYKTKLNCPCCSSRKKDTVLTKCFHVFCAECIRTRYETRQRKCPKCNAAFGANDFHKIYLS